MNHESARGSVSEELLGRAEGWLSRRGLAATDERINLLVTMQQQMPWESWPARACRHLLRHGKIPTGDDITAQLEKWRVRLQDFAVENPEIDAIVVGRVFAGDPTRDGTPLVEAMALGRLLKAGRKLTPEGLAALTPLLPADGRVSDLWMWLLEHGEWPTPEAIAAARARKKRRQSVASHRERIASGRFPAKVAKREAEVAQWVADYRSEHGQGPRWAEVQAAFGLGRFEGVCVLRQLCELGWLQATSEARSLRPGARWAEHARANRDAVPTPRTAPEAIFTDA